MINGGFFGAAAASQVIGSSPPSEGWAKTNDGLLGISSSQSTSCKLNSNKVCFLNNGSNLLEVYNTPSLTEVGSGEDIGTVNNDGFVTRLTDNEVLASHNGTVFQKYVWDDGLETWSTEGSSINLGEDAKVVGASSTRFFAFRSLTDAGVSCWDLSGGTWSQTGTTKTYATSLARQAIALLDNTNNAEVLACYTYQTAGDSQNEIHAISFNGSSFTDIDTISVGTGSDSFPSMARLTDTSFAFFGNITEVLERWTLSASTLAISDTVDLAATENAVLISPYDDGVINLSSGGGTRYQLQFWTYTPAV